MSAESLEDGEIASEHEPSPDAVDVDDEYEIDQIIENENNQSTSSQRVINSPEKSRRPSKNHRNNSRYQRYPQNQPPSLMATSWHTIGNNGNQGGNQQQPRQIRQPPSESVIFGIQNTSTSTPEQFMQPPPPLMQQQLMVSPDITRLQNIVNHQRDYYQPPPGIGGPTRVPYHFFQSPSDMRTPLMSIPMQQQRSMPPLLPHPQPQMLQHLSTPTTSTNTSWRRDNYEQIAMEMSPEEPPAYSQNDPFVKPPVQIPLEPVVTSTTSSSTPEAQKKPQKAPATEDEATLRAFLLANMNPGGKRPTSSAGTPSEPKRTRKNSVPQLSSSVVSVFGAKPIPPPPPVPKIQVNIGKVQLAPEVSAPAPEPEPEPEPAPVVEEELSREEKREKLEKRMKEIEKLFQEQKEKVTEAGKSSKVAATMAAKAEELAKQAEKMNAEAVELRQKCIESTRVGKEEMRKILIEKRALQTAIDEMNIDDMEEIDCEEFPVIFFASVKKDSAPKPMVKDEKPEAALSETPRARPAPEARSLETRAPETSGAPEARAPESSRAPERQEGGRNESREMEQVVRIQEQEEQENDHSEDAEEEEMEHVEEDEQEEEELEEEQEQEIEGEDEYESEEEEEEDVATAPSTTTPLMSPLKATDVPPLSQKIEDEMRARLLGKIVKNDTSRKSPEVSSSQPDRAVECRAVLAKMCKFELNGKCERPRDCQFLHMHNINDTKQQTQILEGLFRDVFQYQEADIDTAVSQTMHFLPEFRAFEKLMDQFFKVVIQQTPDYKSRLFQFFAQTRR